MARPRSLETSDGGVKRLLLVETMGDLFEAPPKSVLIHACNCLGQWGAGIAATFRTNYPQQYKLHTRHCKSTSDPAKLRGSAQLISPVEGSETQHYLGCIFTSKDMGRRKDSRALILKNTKSAMEDLLRLVTELKRNGHDAGDLRMCRINSGLFNVPWEDTKRVLSEIAISSDDMPTTVTVVHQD